tara:strand:+ start:493 stop:894 length:402 start_codon:yes stop_codon:yes gene_type:complete
MNIMIKYTSVRTIDLEEWDGFVEETYGRPYSFQQQDGCKGRGIHTFDVPSARPYDYKNDTVTEEASHADMGVSFKAWLERDPKQAIPPKGNYTFHLTPMWWARNFYPSVDMVINDLYAKGLIEAGNYHINIDW